MLATKSIGNYRNLWALLVLENLNEIYYAFYIKTKYN